MLHSQAMLSAILLLASSAASLSVATPNGPPALEQYVDARFKLALMVAARTPHGDTPWRYPS